MREIYARGPITCSIAAMDDLVYSYRGGLYTDPKNYTKDDVDHDIEVRNGSDMKSIHVHKWATPAEVCVANKAVPFIPEGPFMQNTVFACDLCLDRGWVSDENGEESRCPCPKGREFEGAQI